MQTTIIPARERSEGQETLDRLERELAGGPYLARPRGRAVVSARGLTRVYGKGDAAVHALAGVDLDLSEGHLTAIMGPSGSGKSTLMHILAGLDQPTEGRVSIDGVELTGLSVDERAKAGLFLAMQYPVEVPGVSTSNFLRTAKTALDGQAPKVRTWPKVVSGALTRLEMDPDFATRSVNEGFSGGEKKRGEIVQLDVLNPKVAVL
ncbi:MAG TPA: ATP-binding cassette domain-containing protein, partial [Thermoleophilia bacterium]|nr:ATP-binding cassette domain-containing protein [Thermoleophilia bacterium]